MNTFSDVIDKFGYAKLAAMLGKPEGTVSSWKSRDLIPSEYWLAVVEEAARENIEGITLELLARLDAERLATRRREHSTPFPPTPKPDPAGAAA